jgi:hypothetical protein
VRLTEDAEATTSEEAGIQWSGATTLGSAFLFSEHPVELLALCSFVLGLQLVKLRRSPLQLAWLCPNPRCL